jgi:hypothetical protein
MRGLNSKHKIITCLSSQKRNMNLETEAQSENLPQNGKSIRKRESVKKVKPQNLKVTVDNIYEFIEYKEFDFKLY